MNAVAARKALSFEHLPRLAAYIRTHRLEEYIAVQEKLSEPLRLSIMEAFKKVPPEKQQQLVHDSVVEFLDNLSHNDAEKQIRDAIARWKNNDLQFIDRAEVASEDITTITYLHKQTLMHFVPEFCMEIGQAMPLIEEIDRFLMHLEAASVKAYGQILQEKVAGHSHFINRVNELLPGAVYIFDLPSFRNVYANENLANVFGFNADELNDLNKDAVPFTVHEEDQPVVHEHMQALQTAADGQILNCKYRVRQKDGQYKWLRTYASVFRRNEKGEVQQTISISLDVDKEKKISEALRRHEEQLLEAQEIAQMGSFTWNLNGEGSSMSAQLKKILCIDSIDKEMDVLFARVHPDDIDYMNSQVEAFRETGEYDCSFRYIVGDTEKTLWVRGRGIRIGETITGMNGTVMDISTRAELINRAEENERLYKGAEALANMGSWRWNMETGELAWTDQLYKIYGLEPQSEKMTIERFLDFVHPADKQQIEESIRKGNEEILTNHNFRIIAADGTEKMLHSIAQPILNDAGQVMGMVGTEQDITEKQKLIEQLKQSEALYKQAQGLAHVGNWILDLKTRKLQWSEELYRIYALDPSEVIDEARWYEWVHPEDLPEVRSYLQNCLEKKTRYDSIHRIVLHDGVVKTIHRKGEFIFDEKGEAVSLVGYTQDVTEQMRMQRDLDEKQNLIRKITDATPSIIATYQVQTGKYVFVSEGMRKLLGYEPPDILEKGVAFTISIIHPDDLGPFMEHYNQALAQWNDGSSSRDVIEFTYRARHADGNYRWLHTYGTVFARNSQGEVEYLLNISLDVTEQVAATRKIKEQEYFIEQIADASPTVLYLFNVGSGNFGYINREVFYVLGYTPEELMAITPEQLRDLYHPEDYKLLPERTGSESRFQYQESMMQYECRIKNKEGGWTWFLIREIVFRKDASGEVEQILGAALDITKRKDMERTLLQNAHQLEQSNSSLEEFAYVASHDLKEPLRKISTFGDRLSATQAECMTADGQVYLKKIIEASRRMQMMIDDLLAVSMITGNRGFEKCSLQTILEDARQAVEFKIEQKGAVINAMVLPEAHIIPSQFRQLFQNLLSNSLKFARENVQPQLTIRYDWLTAAEVEHLQMPHAQKYLRLQFSDNGIGFENEYAGKIFQIFQRLHGRSEYEGTGIGLAICKKIVEHHGGVIYAEGVPGSGAQFTIVLPQ